MNRITRFPETGTFQRTFQLILSMEPFGAWGDLVVIAPEDLSTYECSAQILWADHAGDPSHTAIKGIGQLLKVLEHEGMKSEVFPAGSASSARWLKGAPDAPG